MLNETLDLAPLWLSIKLALMTVWVLLIIGTPLAWWLARTKNPLKYVIEAIVALPLVLPPTVLGFYLLIFLGSKGPLGTVWEMIGGGSLVFTFTGLVIGSVIYSLPFVVQPLHNAFAAISDKTLAAAATLRASPLDRFFTVVAPLAKRGFITAAVLGFTHTLGEFGIVLMIGGNIPNETKVLSIAIYDHVEQLEYTQAHWFSGGLLVFSFLIMLAIFVLNRKKI